MSRRTVLLPWEPDPQAPRPPMVPYLSLREPANRPVLYGPKGEPLTWPKRPLGFGRPDDDRGR